MAFSARKSSAARHQEIPLPAKFWAELTCSKRAGVFLHQSVPIGIGSAEFASIWRTLTHAGL
jgi:hypothetical protein